MSEMLVKDWETVPDKEAKQTWQLNQLDSELDLRIRCQGNFPILRAEGNCRYAEERPCLQEIHTKALGADVASD